MRTKRTPVPNLALYNLRDARGLTQDELAAELEALARAHGKTTSVDGMTISRWERGVIDRPHAYHRRLLAEFFGVSLAELGMTRPRTGKDHAGTVTYLPGDPRNRTWLINEDLGYAVRREAS